ncbi:hypothetical protein A3759_07890 [Thalassolituus sp. HI0120]|nr:hypothetical protein A3759_07890 [Thalassolituus sp. HI0120]
MKRFSVRIFLSFLILISISSYWSFSSFEQELRPALKNATEETLVDTANLIAEFITSDLVNSSFNIDRLQDISEHFKQRQINADIWSVHKLRSNLEFYLTDNNGIVLFDSRGEAQDEDYSRWNDVFLTLQGEYGARTTRAEKHDASTSTMYVAAPVYFQQELFGVVTLIKPNDAIQPFVLSSWQKIRNESLWLLALSCFLAGLLSWYLTLAVAKLQNYVSALRTGKRGVEKPDLGSHELQNLVEAVNDLETELAGKDYIEKYVQVLTHELKSPVAAVVGAAELLQLPMEEQQKQLFSKNIFEQGKRLEDMISRMLALTTLENRTRQETPELIDIPDLLQAMCISYQDRADAKAVRLKVVNKVPLSITAERFLVVQALDNLLANALDFSSSATVIEIGCYQDTDVHPSAVVYVLDQGSGIPDYARDRIFERFYSLPRADKGKSSGLGLSFVSQIMELHGGKVDISANPDGDGTLARLIFPALH